MFSSDTRPPDGPVAPISFEQAVQLLHMHRNQVRGIGKPMRRPRRWTFDEAVQLLERELARLERGRGASAAGKARHEAEWARRRRAG